MSRLGIGLLHISMDRETTTIKTPVDKHEIVLKSWITGREKRELRKPFLKEIKISLKKGEKDAEAESFNSFEAMNEAENKAIEIMIVSINGKKENILNTVLDMKEKDYSFIIKEINKITKEEDEESPFPKPE